MPRATNKSRTPAAASPKPNATAFAGTATSHAGNHRAGAGHPQATSAAPAHQGNGHDASGWAGQLRLPMSWGLQTLMLMLHAGEEFQRAQLDCWHLALKRREQAHERLLTCEDSAEMASVQADLLRFDTANFTQLAQRYMDMGVHLNTDLARLVAQSMDGSRHQLMRSAFESFQSGIRTGFRPLDGIFASPILRELVTPKAAAH